MEFLDYNSNQFLSDNFVADMKKHYDQHRDEKDMQEHEANYHPERATTSHDQDFHRQRRVTETPTRDNFIQKMIQEAEKKKIKPSTTPGRSGTNQFQFDMRNSYVHSAMVNETYMMVASHLDELTIKKIEQGDFVDFLRLIPKDKVVSESEETEMKMIMKEGKTFYVPVRDGQSITGFGKWEQAFRVYSNIYTRIHLERATELIQYNHVIHTASLIYVWSNVYAYDQDFRLHMSKHPGRSWSILLQQSWSMRLQEKLQFNSFHRQLQGKPHKHNGKNSPPEVDYCRKYNKGRCNFGAGCRFKHKCSYCFKFGHNILVCHKLIYDQEHKVNRRDRKENEEHKSQRKS